MTSGMRGTNIEIPIQLAVVQLSAIRSDSCRNQVAAKGVHAIMRPVAPYPQRDQQQAEDAAPHRPGDSQLAESHSPINLASMSRRFSHSLASTLDAVVACRHRPWLP